MMTAYKLRGYLRCTKRYDPWAGPLSWPRNVTNKNGIQEIFDPRGRKHYWIGGGAVHWSDEEDTDERAVLEGCISITPIHLDLTNHSGLDFLKNRWQR